MSAAEKLERLHALAKTEPPTLESGLFGLEEEEASSYLLDALPQIVALVEAAEQSKRFLMDVLYDRRPEPGHEPTVEEARLLSAETVIASALAALDEKLGAVT